MSPCGFFPPNRHHRRQSSTIILFPLTIILTSQLVATALGSATVPPNTSNIFNGNFQMYNEFSRDPFLSSKCSIKDTPYSRIKCVDWCVGDEWCVAVYAERVDSGGGGEGVWRCYLCVVVWNVTSLEPGTGHYGVAMYPNRGLSTSEPTLTGTLFEGVGPMHGTMAATFRCPHHIGHYIHLAFNTHTRTWPAFSNGCSQTMCRMESVRDILIDVETVSNSGMYHFHPVCGQDEIAHGHGVCQGGGVWTEYDVLLRMCIPTNCVYFNSVNRPVYGGTIATTTNGRACQRWDEDNPHRHDYNGIWDYHMLVEDGNYSLAENYCRATLEFYIWCFTTDPLYRWELCNIPSC